MSPPPWVPDPAFGAGGVYNVPVTVPSHAGSHNVTSRPPFLVASSNPTHAELPSGVIGPRQPDNGRTETAEEHDNTPCRPVFLEGVKKEGTKGRNEKNEKRGKSAYQWNGIKDKDGEAPSWYRKLARLKHYTKIPFEKIYKALEDAGGPGPQTTRKFVETHSQEKPGDGRLKAGNDLTRRDKGVERAAGQSRARDTPEGHDASVCRHVANTSTTPVETAPGACETPSGRGEFPSLQEPLSIPQYEATVRVLASEDAYSSGLATRDDTSAKRPHDGENASPDKRRRRTSPRTSAAQIDPMRFVQHLAELSGKPMELLDHVINRMSGSSASRSYVSSTESNTARSEQRWSQRSSYQQSALDNSREQQYPARRKSVSNTLKSDCHPQTDVTTLRSLFALLGSWDGFEESLAKDIHSQLNAHAVKATVATKDGISALHLAVKLGYPTVCAILLWAGADCRAKTAMGADAYDYARKAQRAAASNGPLLNRITKCRQHVKFGLEKDRTLSSHPLSPKGASLRDLCNQLDPDPERKEARCAQRTPTDYRASGSMKPPAASLGTIDETPVLGMMPPGGPTSYSNANASGPLQQPALLPSPPDSSSAVSPGDGAGDDLVEQHSLNPQEVNGTKPLSTRPQAMYYQPALNFSTLATDQQFSALHQASAPAVDTLSTTDRGQAFLRHDSAPNEDSLVLGVTRETSNDFAQNSGQNGGYYGGKSHSSVSTAPFNPRHLAEDAVQGERQRRAQDLTEGNSYYFEHVYAGTSRMALQDVAPNGVSNSTMQPIGVTSQSGPSELEEFSIQAYTTPHGLGLDPDGRWANDDPLAHTAVQPDENLAPRSAGADTGLVIGSQTAEEKSRVTQLILQYEQRNMWVSCTHNYPHAFDYSYCPLGCAALLRERPTNALPSSSRRRFG
ncbi:hypothetical protein LTR85_009603 [Meristemomyces frigidus]|nr:hypothetical protein LTR85_009603 [Meristemomyces frigidus]